MTQTLPGLQNLLTTKLYLPPPRPDAVARPRLVEMLQQGLRRKLVLVSAPPGFGKTSAVAEWHFSQTGKQIPLGWVSLDEGDNDPVRFWSYFIAAFQRLKPGLGQAAYEFLQTAGQTASQNQFVEPLLTALINEIAATLPETFALALDDYHVIENASIHQGIAFLLDHLPRQMHLILTSRVDPLSLPLARMRVRGELAEIRAANLRFTTDEAASFLNATLEQSLSLEDVEQLTTRTEGWAAGLQMAALSLEGCEDVHKFVTSFAGDDRYLVDYLIEEVLERQSSTLQAFLLETSILDRLSGPLCQAVTGQEDAQNTLTRLEQRNIFLIPLDNRRVWFRYHHLFAELLRYHLSQTRTSAEVDALYLRASYWFEQNAQHREAVRFALDGHAYERAADLFDLMVAEMTVRTELITLQKWYSALPDEAIRARPMLCMCYGWLLLLTGRWQQVEIYTDAAEKVFARTAATDKNPNRVQVPGNVAVLRAFMARHSGDLARAISLSQEALKLLPLDSYTARSRVFVNLGQAYSQIGHFKEAEETYREATRNALANKSAYSYANTTSQLVMFELARGHLNKAAALCEDAIQICASHESSSALKDGQYMPIASEAYLMQARICLEGNELEKAEMLAGKVLEMEKFLSNLEISLGARQQLAELQGLLGRPEKGLNTFKEAVSLSQKTRHLNLEQTSGALRTRLLLLQATPASLKEAVQWANSVETRFTNLSGLTFDGWSEALTMVRVFLAQKEYARTSQWLARLQTEAQEKGWTGYLIKIQSLQALVQAENGEINKAITTLVAALALAEPEGYVQLFVNGGATLQALLQRIAANAGFYHLSETYLNKLLAAFPDRQSAPETAILPEGLLGSGEARIDYPANLRQLSPLERPSERELEVLRLIASGLSNQEIAERLVVSGNTIKAHINKIYAKLNVGSRTQAIARARELNLL
ncbi:MAG TPA: LuxR C-terminal-related transcriptional regulator [Chloroflexia bacterium]|nr:LuxR C-terminal-related transcriptional regulator [Chloroflexia bacterium]